MEIGYQTLERLLVVLFELSEGQRGALLGKFKYLQRLGGFGSRPHGGRARYQLDELLQLLVIFELLDVGCSPTQAVRTVRTHWNDLSVNLAYAWNDARSRLSGGTPETMMWTVIPHALAELGAGDAMIDVDLLEDAGELGPAEVLAWKPGKALGGNRHAIFIHLPRLLASCLEALAIVAPEQQQPFTTALDQLWAAQDIGKVR